MLFNESNTELDGTRAPVSQDLWQGMSVDFRSTKCNVYWAALRDRGGQGVGVLTDGTQHVRAVREKDGIRLHTMDDYLGGKEEHLRKSVTWPPRPAKDGMSLRTRVVLIRE